MRKFSDFEKRIIRAAVEVKPENSNVATFISNCILKDRGIQIKKDEKELVLRYFKSNTNAISEFFEIIALIKFLEHSYLIFIHSDPQQDGGEKNFLVKNIDQSYVDSHKNNFQKVSIPTNVYEDIIRYIGSYMVVGTELKILVQNQFVTSEEKRHKTEIKIARWSFVIALIGLLFSLLSPHLFDINIKQKQIDEIRTDLEKINLSIDSLRAPVKPSYLENKEMDTNQ